MRRSDRIFLAVTILPALAVIGFVVLYPLVRSVAFSFTNYNLVLRTNAYVGISNYRQLFSDPTLVTVLVNTVWIGFTSVVVAFLIGFAQALVLNQAIVASSFFRGLALIPWVIPQIVVAYLFRFVFDPSIGVVNVVLKDIHVINHYLPWLALPSSAPWAVILAYTWNEAPFFMLMLLAGLQGIPRSSMDAAAIDGAGPVAQFRYIILPGLRNVIAISTVLMVIWNFNNFTIIWPMTHGGPVNATTTFAVWVYRQAFQNFNIGYAATIGVIWLVILMTLTFFYVRAVSAEGEQ